MASPTVFPAISVALMYARNVVEPGILAERRAFSNVRVAELRRRIQSSDSVRKIDNLMIFCAGSYARDEASEHSDVDLFFVYDGAVDSPSRRTDEIELFAAVIEIARNMGFPKFSNDGKYLHTLESGAMLEHLGGAEDDFKNYFTMRMLLLLESNCISGEEIYNRVRKQIIEAYYRDYPDHQSTFEPWFLINDIMRYWKTLLLNYENKRWQKTSQDQKSKQKVKNFKLKYSRMATCFATIAALGSCVNPVEMNTVLSIVGLTPQDRLHHVKSNLPEISDTVDGVLDDYSWFIEQTGKTESELLAGFLDHRSREENFKKANMFGHAMFDLLRDIDQAQLSRGVERRLLRYLVI
ncbi:MAG: nucleotidyltransferase domain-containing protein [Gordonia paraffinivorans]